MPHQRQQEREIIDGSGLFDAVWYLSEYPDVRSAGLDPLEHFLNTGVGEGRCPNILFDTRWYVSQNPAAESPAANALVHYIQTGAATGRNPHPLFCGAWVERQLGPRRDGDQATLLARYLLAAQTANVTPHPLIDAHWYLDQYPDVAAAGINAALHFLQSGAREERDPNPLFCTRWYRSSHKWVRDSGLNPLVCYASASLRHRGDPSVLFSSRHYLELHPELRDAAVDPLLHVLQTAREQGCHVEELIAADRASVQDKWLGRSLDVPPQRLAVGLVLYNNPQRQIDFALQSIAIAGNAKACALTSLDVFMIDNGASDSDRGDMPTTRQVSSLPVTQLPSRGNIGFGRAHNALMAQAFAQGADAYVACNPDGAFHPDAIAALLAMHHACGHAALIEAMQFPEEHPKAFNTWNFDTPWASGACVLIPRSLHQSVGDFDDHFFMYCEDVDLSWRARTAGLAVKTCPAALFFHPVTNRPFDRTAHARSMQAGLILATKWRGKAFAHTVRQQMVAEAIDAPDVSAVTVRPVAQGIADFDHGFSFAPVRW